MPFEIKNEIVIITGSAQGIGKEIAKRVLAKGAKVCISDVNEELGLKTVEELQKTYGENEVTFKRCDVSEETEWQDLWTHTEKTFSGKVSILVNNAGINPKHGWNACIDIMLKGVGYGMFLALEKMGTSKGGHGGRIVNVASMAGLIYEVENIHNVRYTAAKHGVVALTRSFETSGVEYSEGVKSYAICPYFADTSVFRETFNAEELTRQNKKLLTLDEIGNSFDMSLELDNNGACYAVFPDCPPFPMPNISMALLGVMICFGKFLGAPMGLKTFDWKHVIASLALILFLLYMALCIKALIC